MNWQTDRPHNMDLHFVSLKTHYTNKSIFSELNICFTLNYKYSLDALIENGPLRDQSGYDTAGL